jgi:hypothetical protein
LFSGTHDFKRCWRRQCNVIRFSEAFPDPNALLAEAFASASRASSRSGKMRLIDLARGAAG